MPLRKPVSPMTSLSVPSSEWLSPTLEEDTGLHTPSGRWFPFVFDSAATFSTKRVLLLLTVILLSAA